MSFRSLFEGWSARRSKGQHRRLGRFEPLENRLLLAGDMLGFQTQLLRDLDPVAESAPGGFTKVGDSIYFAANVDQLWKTDGSSAGTILVKDLVPDSESAFGPFRLTDVAGTLRFVSGNELWTSDGTIEATTTLQTFASSPVKLTPVGDDLFFLAAGQDAQGVERPVTLWRNQGANNAVVFNSPGEIFEDIRHLTEFQGSLFFLGQGTDPVDSSTKWGLWRTNGETNGHEFMHEFPPINGSADVSEFAVAGTNLFFFADDGTHGKELWKSDGTPAGTQLVRDINPNGNSMFSFGDNLRENIGDTLFFIANDGSTGRELWSSDGTLAGTAAIGDLNPNGSFFFTFGDTSLLSAVNQELFFTPGGGPSAGQIWKTDGTPEGTTVVTQGLDAPRDLVSFERHLFFTAASQLWHSDGTDEGTSQLVGPTRPVFLVSTPNVLIFNAEDDTASNSEPWTVTPLPPASLSASLVASLVTVEDRATTSSVFVNVSQQTTLDAWIDFNRDGDWNDANEQVFASHDLGIGGNLLSFTIPAGASTGDASARFRISSGGGTQPNDAAAEGEVTDHLLTILAASASTPAQAQFTPPIAGELDLLVDTDEVVARATGIEVFRAPGNVLNRLTFAGTTGNDQLNISNIDSIFSGEITGDAKSGVDTLRLSGSDQTLTLIGENAADIRGLEVIDIRGSGDNEITLNHESIARVSPDSKLRVTSNVGDQVDFGVGWSLSDAFVQAGDLVKVLSQGDVTLELIGPSDWVNPINSLDVDGDGSVVPLDALIVINELNDPRFSDNARLRSPAQLGARLVYFFDVVPDNFVAPIDALRIINFLNESAEGEASIVPAFTGIPLSSIAESRNNAGATRQHSNVAKDTSGLFKDASPKSLPVSVAIQSAVTAPSASVKLVDHSKTTSSADNELSDASLFDDMDSLLS